jgi:NADH-quinone oxidoreductase subunit J
MSTAALLGGFAAGPVATALAETGRTSTAEAWLFWTVGPVMVLAALGLLFARRTIYAAMSVVLVMICLAILYVAQEAPFLGVVQVVVYTGAVMMLFLFVLMLVGVDSSDSLVETIKGHRIAAMVAGFGFGVLVLAGLGNAAVEGFSGLGAANAGGNVESLAALIFTRYVFAFELTGALLITAALAAMVLGHQERVGRRVTQKELSVQRFKSGGIVTPMPAPGVYARHNAVDTPALLPDGTPSELSVSPVLRARGSVRTIDSARRGDRVPDLAHEPIGPNNSELPEIDVEAAIHDSSQLGKGPTP